MVYVDDYEGKFGRMIMCHMVSDSSLDELHDFAKQIGMRKSWFQDKTTPHYDLSKSKRAEALKAGAAELPIRLDGGASFNPEWRRVIHAARRLKAVPAK